jgi:hypothetical protein
LTNHIFKSTAKILKSKLNDKIYFQIHISKEDNKDKVNRCRKHLCMNFDRYLDLFAAGALGDMFHFGILTSYA